MERITKITVLLLIFCLAATSVNIFVFNGRLFAYAQTDNQSSLINQQINELNDGITDKKSDIQKMQQRENEYANAIKEKQTEKASLNNQLAILDNRLAKAELDIELVQTDIERVGLEIQKTDLAITTKNKEIEREKSHIADVLNLIHKQDNVSTLEVMLLNSSLADFLAQAKYLEDVNENVQESLDDLEQLKRGLEAEKSGLSSQNTELAGLKSDLEEKQKGLASEKDTKVYVLGQVAQSETQYQRLLAQAKKEQEAAAADIATMEKQVRAKVAELEGHDLEFNDSGFIWPVPKNTITAYFHDPDYPFRYIFEHPAVDIRAAQGTPLKAAASGYVARTVYGSHGSYGYIMLIHGDGLATVYGHVSKISVAEDDYVVQGQVIGASGGLPGTDGSGGLTTGPHLHFEVRLNGIPVDPLAYLP